MDELRTKLTELIENNKIDQAIKLLKEESAKRGGRLDHIIISLSSRYKRYREKSLMGLEAREQEFTKIVSDALELVKALDDPSQVVKSESTVSSQSSEFTQSAPPSSPAGVQSNKFVQMAIGGLAVIGLIALIVVFSGGDDTGADEPAYTDTYMESDMSGGASGEFINIDDVSGNWIQVAQNLGPDNDCPDCTIDIAQNGEYISVSSNIGWVAELSFNDQSGAFEGLLNWGDLSPDDPDQNVQLFLDENNEVIVHTYIQGVQYSMAYAEN